MSIPWRNLRELPSLKCDTCGKVISNQNYGDFGSLALLRLAHKEGWRSLDAHRAKHVCPECPLEVPKVEVVL